jgi:hypothetical protein
VPVKKEKKPISVTHPELAKEADGWDPSSVTSGSGKKLLWKCSKGHNWEATVANRSGKEKNSCPYCGNKKVLPGFNDLKTKFPQLAAEADGWDPGKVHPGTHQKYSWICVLGHRFESSPSQRTTRGAGCSVCSGRKLQKGFNDLATTHKALSKESNGWDPSTVSAGTNGKFSWKCKLGHIWEATIPNRAVNKSGCPFCSGRNVQSGFNDLATSHPSIAREAVGWNPKTVSKGSHTKLKWICKVGHTWIATPNSRTGKNSGCPVCAGVLVVPGENDLGTTHPEIALEADNWNPTDFYHGSEIKLPWICPLGHKYVSSLKHRCIRKQGCPYCSGRKVLIGFNDLQTKFPLIAKEAFGWDATKIGSGSDKKYEWICENGHRWKAAIKLRTGAETGCPSCSISGFDPNKDSWLYFLQHPTWEMFQIGITNDLKRRNAEHSLNGWKLIESRGPMDGHLTQQWETAILRMLRANGADLSNTKIAGKFDGYSEAWSKTTFDVKSIKELMKLTEEFEESD